MKRLAAALLLAPLWGPVAAGLLGLILPAAGILPALGLTSPSLAPVRTLLETPGLARAAALSAGTGLAATLLSLGITIALLASFSQSRAFALARRALAPLLSVPHAAAAFGLAFLIAPSGWLARLASPGLTGWDRPPDLLILNDPAGLAMIAGLVLKEVPFLLLMSLAALPQIPARRLLPLAASLGYSPPVAWLKAVFPLLYRQIRMPVLVVLAYSMTAIETALILGPTTPPPLAILVLRWANHPDLTQRSIAAAGALALLALVALGFLLWLALEKGVARAGRRWLFSGARETGRRALPVFSALSAGAVFAAAAAALIPLALWSGAGLWRFPESWPQSWSFDIWARQIGPLWGSLARTIPLAAAISAAALLAAIALLHIAPRRARSPWIYLPLLVPQIAFLPGLQILFLSLGARAGLGPVAWGHLVFVFPYVLLALRDPWRAWDPRIAQVAAGLGAPPWRVLMRLRLPMMLAPLLTAWAVGVAVSVGLYLPTLLLSGGRVQTITSEAMALAAGSDRRVIAIWAIGQILAAILPFALALSLPRILFANRKGMLNV